MDRKTRAILGFGLLVVLLLAGGGTIFVLTRPTPSPPAHAADTVPEQAVIRIPLTGPVAQPNAEISGMAWYGDAESEFQLILLPQYPSRLGNALFALPQTAILAYLDGTGAAALEPQSIALDDAGIAKQIDLFQGYEAIAFSGERVFLTIEAGRGAAMMGYLVAGTLAPDLSTLALDAGRITPIAPQSALDNTTDEALLIVGDVLVTLYEENGIDVNPSPVAHRFDFELNALDSVPFPNIEYRITDAADLESEGYFWAMNYFFPGDKAQAPEDPLIAIYGQGQTHSQNAWVERLLLFQYAESGITLVDQAPIPLELSDEARNWEGVVKLDERGFLLVTDKHPETILGFVKQP